MALYRAGRFLAAAEAFHHFAGEHPASGLVDDSTFLEAVCLASAGRQDAAGLAAERHILRFPASFHRKDAAILVARAARARGDCDAARQALAPWLGSPDPAVQQALGSCAPP
jgi:TolA-binding protein